MARESKEDGDYIIAFAYYLRCVPVHGCIFS